METDSLTTGFGRISLKDYQAICTGNKTTLTAPPDETLLLIFSLDPLDYVDLKRLSRVCKRFSEIEKDSTLDSKMFRKGLPPYARWEDRVTIVKKGMKVDLHPVLRATFKGRRIITCASQFGEPTRAGQESFTRWRDSRIKLSFSKEYVTSPPVRTFLGNNGIGYVGMGNQGCTIADILRIQSGDYAMDVDSLWRFRRSCVQREWGRMHGRELEEMIDCCDKVPRNGSRALNSFLWRGEMTLESAQDDIVQLCDIESPFFVPSYMNAWSRYG